MSGPRGAANRGLLSPLRLLLMPLLLLALAGCSSLHTGPVQAPSYYPDRTSPDAAMATFLWAWKTGDLEILDQVLGMWLHKELEELVAKQDKEAVAAYYRNGAANLSVLDYEWRKEGDEIHYLRIVLSTEPVKRLELDFALYRFPLGWVVTGQKLVPRSVR